MPFRHLGTRRRPQRRTGRRGRGGGNDGRKNIGLIFGLETGSLSAPVATLSRREGMKRVKWALIMAVVSAMIATPVLSFAADAPAEAPKAEAPKAEAAAAPKAEAPK